MAKKGTKGGQQLDLFSGVNTTQQLNNQLAEIERKITALYGSTYKFAAQLAQVKTAVNSGQEFTWAENPEAAKQIEARLQSIATSLDTQLGKATETSYALGQASTENALSKAFGKGRQTQKEVKAITADAAAEMRRRGADGHTYYTQQRGGVTISDRVWNITESTKLEIEIAIQQAALEGKSADELAQTIQQYLNHPERLFRSVRVIDPVTGEWTGEYRMSKAAQQCHPGQGVYRSAYKNALRLARTEMTQAYRRAEWESYQDNPLITGYRIELSNNHTTTITTSKGKKVVPLKDICDEMAGTQYPKTFLWTGWHPQCRCRMVPITISKDDFKERVKARQRKKLDEWKPTEQTTEMPKAFTDWVEANKKRWQQPGRSVPYFIKDNYQQGNANKGLDTRITAELEQARLAAEAAAKAAPKIPEPITDYDNEVKSLRNIASVFELDLTKMEQIRAAGEDKIALRNEIDRLTNEWGTRKREWNRASNSARKVYRELWVLADTIKKESGKPSQYVDSFVLAEIDADIIAENNMTNYRESIKRLTDIQDNIIQTIYEVKKELEAIRAATNKVPDFPRNSYETLDAKGQLEFLANRLDALNMSAGSNASGTIAYNVKDYKNLAADPNATKTQINKAIKAAKTDIDTLTKHLSKELQKNLKDYTTGKQTEELDMDLDTTRKFAAALGVDQTTATDYEVAIKCFSYQWDYEIRAYQTGKTFRSRHGHTKEDVKKAAADLEAFIARAPSWIGDSYRGINISDADLAPYRNVGHVFDMRGTSSWSTKTNVARNFAGKGGNGNEVVFVCKGGQPRGTSIRPISSYPGEHEILTSMTARWRVTKFSELYPGRYEIECEPL